MNGYDQREVMYRPSRPLNVELPMAVRVTLDRVRTEMVAAISEQTFLADEAVASAIEEAVKSFDLKKEVTAAVHAKMSHLTRQYVEVAVTEVIMDPEVSKLITNKIADRIRDEPKWW